VLQLCEWVSIQLATLIKQQKIRAAKLQTVIDATAKPADSDEKRALWQRTSDHTGAPYFLTFQNEDPSGTFIEHRCTASVGFAMLSLVNVDHKIALGAPIIRRASQPATLDVHPFIHLMLCKQYSTKARLLSRFPAVYPMGESFRELQLHDAPSYLSQCLQLAFGVQNSFDSCRERMQLA
jgi:hypothetical protein